MWLALDPHTPDLAAATYRADLFGRLGFVVWDAHWYGGHDLPGYSLLFAPLAALLGVRALAALCALASAALFSRIAFDVYGCGGRWGAAAFAIAASADAWMGRVAFALGVTLGVAAVLARIRAHGALAAACAALCALASPVAGVLLALAGFTHALHARCARSALVLGVCPLAVCAAMAALFGEGGFEPFALTSLLATLGVGAAVAIALARGQDLLRLGALAFLAACVAAALVHTPMGSNAARYGVLLAGPLLLCAALGAPRVRITPQLVIALLAWAVWMAWGPVRETLAVRGDPSTSAAYYVPVKDFFAGRGAVRVEVPLTRSHWEAALLAGEVALARGWEKQLDERYDGALLSLRLTSASYARWLRVNAVSYVALPDARLDPSSAAEGRLIRAGVPYLRLVGALAHWRIYEVLGSEPLVSGPAGVVALGHNRVRLRVREAGRLLLRVHYSRYLSVTRGQGCVARGPEGWTEVTARAPGWLTVRAQFSIAAALGGRMPCPA